MQNLMIFEGHDVEVFELNGQVLFNPYHVGTCLELGDSAVRMAIAKMNEKQVVKIKNSDVSKVDIREFSPWRAKIREKRPSNRIIIERSFKLAVKTNLSECRIPQIKDGFATCFNDLHKYPQLFFWNFGVVIA